MLRSVFRFVAIFLITFTSSLARGESWTELKIGMSPEETVKLLGVPLIRTGANGYEVWIYDDHAEVVFYGGPLVGWTTPSNGTVAGQVVDVWQRRSGQASSPSFVLPRFRAPAKIGERRESGGVYSLPYYRVVS